LLAILAAEGFYSLKIARQIQVSNTEMRRDFLSRDRTLEQIRSALYESGNVVRDYVLVEPGENKAETLRTELKTIRDDMETARSGQRFESEHLYLEVLVSLPQHSGRRGSSELAHPPPKAWTSSTALTMRRPRIFTEVSSSERAALSAVVTPR